MLFKSYFLLLATALCLPCYAQAPIGFLTKENLVDVKDSVLKAEISTFTITGKKLFAYTEKNRLNELKMIGASDNRISFDILNFFTFSFMVDITIKDTLPELKEVYFLIGRYFPKTLPDSAISDIYEPRLFENYSTEPSKLVTNCHVYYTKGRSRTYIYMLNGKGATRYEVTWIIKGNKYFGRVIDAVPLEGIY
jgi:hypothetical protein